MRLWYPAIAGACSLFVGIGLCRFAYTPMIPAMVEQGWVTQSGAGYLGAINLFGYLLGACLCRYIHKCCDQHDIIRASLVASMAALAFCAIDLSFVWLAIWRFIAGMTGAWLMIMTPSMVLKHAPPQYKGRMAGAMFTGIGAGVIVSGFVFPALTTVNVSFAWLGAALLVGLATVIAWHAFPREASEVRLNKKSVDKKEEGGVPHMAVTLLGIAYMAYGIGMVPHTLFIVDYVHTQLSLSLVASGLFWSFLGIGATIGPMCVGMLVDRVGVYKSLIVAFSAAVFAILLLVLSHSALFYGISAFLMGVLLSAIPSLMSSRVLDLVGTVQHPLFWGRVIVYCAISQALAAHVMSYLIEHGMAYVDCFAIASLVFALGCIAVIFAKPMRKT